MPPTRAPEPIPAQEAEKQLAELQPQPLESPEAPKSAAPGSHPLKTVEDDPEALRRYRGASATEPDPDDGLWHKTAYGAPVFVPGDRFPPAPEEVERARREQERAAPR